MPAPLPGESFAVAGRFCFKKFARWAPARQCPAAYGRRILSWKKASHRSDDPERHRPHPHGVPHQVWHPAPERAGGQPAGRGHFYPEYRNADAVRGLEDFSHIWLVWQFSAAVRDTWSPTVRPPRLGGNTRMGVFATRSPFRPNPLGLSSVQLEKIEIRPGGGPGPHRAGRRPHGRHPIYDIKPYIPYADCHPDAAAGFTAQTQMHHLNRGRAPPLWARVPEAEQDGPAGRAGP